MIVDFLLAIDDWNLKRYSRNKRRNGLKLAVRSYGKSRIPLACLCCLIENRSACVNKQFEIGGRQSPRLA